MENISRVAVGRKETSSLDKTSRLENEYAKVMGTIVGLQIVAIGALYYLGMYLVAA